VTALMLSAMMLPLLLNAGKTPIEKCMKPTTSLATQKASEASSVKARVHPVEVCRKLVAPLTSQEGGQSVPGGSRCCGAPWER
jgi:hypothetical protein